MERRTVAIFFLSLVLVGNAIIEDYSTIDAGVTCTSNLDVGIKAFGQSKLQDQARIMCRNSCEEGADNFKRIRCPDLCGISAPRPLKCFLCYPNKSYYISICRLLIDLAVKQCEEGCEIAKADFVDGEYRVISSAGAVSKFPSKIFPNRK